MGCSHYNGSQVAELDRRYSIWGEVKETHTGSNPVLTTNRCARLERLGLAMASHTVGFDSLTLTKNKLKIITKRFGRLK